MDGKPHKTRPDRDTDPRDICPVCNNAIILFTLDGSESACSDPDCAAAHGHVPPLTDWRRARRP